MDRGSENAATLRMGAGEINFPHSVIPEAERSEAIRNPDAWFWIPGSLLRSAPE